MRHADSVPCEVICRLPVIKRARGGLVPSLGLVLSESLSSLSCPLVVRGKPFNPQDRC